MCMMPIYSCYLRMYMKYMYTNGCMDVHNRQYSIPFSCFSQHA